MLSIIEQIKQGQLWDFHGGIHPPENKTISSNAPIQHAGVPQQLVLPLKQHIGAKGDIIVAVGDRVLKGQPLTKGDIAMCVPVHAPTSGIISAIEERTIAHPSGLSDLCIVLDSDGDDQWGTQTSIADYTTEEPSNLIEQIRLSGIAGLGGAGFPTSRKLQGGIGNVDILIINAAECEPYITADDRLMQDYAEEVIEGIRILQHIVKPKLTIIGIEDNKPDAIRILEQHVSEDDQILIRVIPTKYPSGSSKQLVKVLTGREVPSQARSTSVGVIVQNIGTAFAVKRAIIDGEPLIERVVTLTGEAFNQRGNVFARLGTPISYLLDSFSYQPDKKYPRVIIGGSLMGFTLPHPNVPITKMTNCVLAPKRKELPLHTHEMACIRCSACADVCPSALLPQQLQWYAKDQDYDKCEEYNLFDCIECGACAYVCPSEIPLVQYYRQAKAEITARQQDEANAERARLRFEAKTARMERDKAERENRFKKAADDRRKEMSSNGSDDAVAAAIARVKAKQAESAAPSSAEPTNDKKPAVAAAIARAKAKQAAAQQAGNDVPDNTEMAKLREERKRQARERKAALQAEQNDSSTETTPETQISGDAKKDAVAAAIARAKARKAAQQNESQTEPAESQQAEADPKKAAVAAAVARAKARKAAQQNESQTESVENQQAEADPKKAAVAAAVARAKARKAAQQTKEQAESQPETVDSSEEVTETKSATEPAVDPKKAVVAAAVARAKARKAAQQAQEQADNTVPQPESQTETVEAQQAEVDPKKAAVAAAVARAKARKAAQQAKEQADNTESLPESQTEPAENQPVETDPKKAAVAAAVARAKARKAAQQAEKAAQQNNEDN